jgi:hypothetical protein
MRHLIWILLTGSALGLGSAALAMMRVGDQGGLQVGPWVTPLDAGGPNRGPYTRAVTALRATLALSRQEAIYFRAATDSAGARLRGDCTYLVHGPDLPARWWSLTLYGADHYLVPNPEHRYAYASVNVRRGADGGFAVSLGPKAEAGDWLDTGHASGIVLLARLYQPRDGAAGDPASLPLPRIDRQSCP